MIRYKQLFFLTILLTISSCTKTYDEDEFYNYIEDFGGLRIPILKPYFVNCPDNYKNYIDMEDEGQINKIEAIAVYDSLIYIKSDNSNSMPMEYKKYFLVEYFYGRETGFYNESELLEYASKKGYKKPNWKDIYVVWKQIDAFGYPWNIKLDSMYKKRLH